MKKSIALFLFFAVATLTLSAGPVDDFTSSRAVSKGNTAVLIKDLRTGKTLASHNAALPLLPASILKTVSIASLLEESGPDAHFHTRVYADGKIKKGTLEGNLVVKGGGDPTLGADCQPASADIMQEIVDVLKSREISMISGGIVVDTSLYAGPACPPSWGSGDLSASYGTGCHALNYRRNASGKSSVKDPVAVFLYQLRNYMEANGISVGNDSPTTSDAESGRMTLLLDHVSDKYAEVMRSCMMRSDNLFAETILRTFGIAQGGDGSTADSAEKEMKKWSDKGFPMEGVHIVDGSGLSRSNRVTADFMTSLLTEMKDDEDFSTFLPLAGQEGTLSGFLKDTPLDAYVAMKTGSMNGIQCYAGYKLDDKFAPTHSIVIIMNGIGNRTEARAAAERMLLSIFSE